MPSLRQLFLDRLAPTSPEPLGLEIEKAEGVFLFDKDGKKYLDAISGIGVSSLGHCHPAVVKAVQQQAETYMHTMVYGEYVLSPQVQYANLLCSQLPETLNSIYYVNSGAEAAEGAMKLAKRVTGRSRIIACKNAYHGSTHGAMSLMSDPTFTQAFRPLVPDIHFIEFNSFEDLQKIDENVAAVIMEPVQGEAGVIPPVPGYLKSVKDKCSEEGALLVFDEVQTGFGRTGSLFAFQKFGVVPDVLMLAKGMGGGMPIGAFVANRDLMEQFSHDPILGHITTFGGHPVSCAAALATLKTLLSEKIVESVNEKGEYLASKLTHPGIKQVRQVGLMIAVELDSFSQVKMVIESAIRNGVIVDWFLFNDHSIRIAPPLIISLEELNLMTKVIFEGISL
ncbi:MAG: aspartate aminotransferase family protein [Saprospiraceae bacterium]|nr:aspartate aminotransferase family protein [Saprospiraceae bacterium]